MKRCNLEETDNGIRLCRGRHEKHEDCEWEYFVPVSAVAAEREACAERLEESEQMYLSVFEAAAIVRSNA